MALHEITVAIVVDIPDEYKDHPMHGVETIALKYAAMATSYRSIGAETARVVETKEIQ